MVKSPSDTTIYVPALNRSSQVPGTLGQGQDNETLNALRKERLVVGDNFNNLGSNDTNLIHSVDDARSTNKDLGGKVNHVNNVKTDIMAKISDFVDQLRLQGDEMELEEEFTNRPKSTINAPDLEDAQRRMEPAIIETEKFKASVEKPPGMSKFDILPVQSNNLLGDHDSSIDSVARQVVGDSGISDDDFFPLDLSH